MFVSRSKYHNLLARCQYLEAELARWKPDRDEKGYFVRRAIMPEIRDRDCSFIERNEA